MLGLDWTVYLCMFFMLLLLWDMVTRYRRREIGIDNINNFKGPLNFPILACIGFIITVFVSWSGWFLGIVASIAVTEEIKVLRIDKNGTHDHFDNVTLRVLVGIFMLSELFVIGCLLRFILHEITIIY